MKPLPSVNAKTKSAVAAYVDRIAVPTFPRDGVASRRHLVATARRGANGVWMTISAALAAVALVAFAPAVVSQVQRVMQAFTVVGGRATQMPVKQVSLQELRADMPFAVVRPVNVPARFEEEIDEVGAGSSGARAMFHYSVAGGPPVLTIIESSASDRTPLDFRMRYETNGETPAMERPALPSPRNSPGTRMAMTLMRNGVRTSFKVTPVTWIVRGTRITLIAVPGTLTRMQTETILRAMH